MNDQDTPSPHASTLIHFYRGEIGRIMIWRMRFDATTNWAIIATGSLAAFAVGTPGMMNETMLISLVVISFFAYIEARRYRFYHAYRARVRMLETHFIAPALQGRERHDMEGPWRDELVQDLIIPSYKCSFAFALGRRFKHIYGALHLFLLLGWGSLVSFRTHSLREWVEGFRIGAIPGSVILGLVLTYIAGLSIVLIRSGALRVQSGEMGRHLNDRPWTVRPSNYEH